MSEHTTIAVDLAKSVFEIVVSERPGRVCRRRRLSRAQMSPFLSQQPPATVLLEACGSSHHWARELQTLGHRVLLLPPQHVRRYVLRDKTDRADEDDDVPRSPLGEHQRCVQPQDQDERSSAIWSRGADAVCGAGRVASRLLIPDDSALFPGTILSTPSES